jgi:DNA-binding NarL/FixJ family response regulator
MSITVFVVDDHAVVRDGLRLLLEAEPDIEVIGGAANGMDALSEVARTCPDVLIMDIAMPKLNGIDATRRIREICPLAQVIVLSMYSTSEHIFQALQAGALGYVLKESAGSELVDAVRAVHGGERHLSRQVSDKIVRDYMYQRVALEAQSPVACLSPREREILQFVAEGKSSTAIAEALCLSSKTVDTYRSRLMKKLSVSDIPSLVKFAIQHGLTAVEEPSP